MAESTAKPDAQSRFILLSGFLLFGGGIHLGHGAALGGRKDVGPTVVALELLLGACGVEVPEPQLVVDDARDLLQGVRDAAGSVCWIGMVCTRKSNVNCRGVSAGFAVVDKLWHC